MADYENDDLVLALLMDGATSKQISTQLDMALRTVELCRSRLMKRYGAKSPVHLGRLATEKRLNGTGGSDQSGNAPH